MIMILVFVEIKRLTVNYLSELSKNSKFYLSELSKNSKFYLSELSNFLSLYLIIKYFSLCRNIFKET